MTAGSLRLVVLALLTGFSPAGAARTGAGPAQAEVSRAQADAAAVRAAQVTLTTTLPVIPPSGFSPWRSAAPNGYRSSADGVVLEVLPLAVTVHADVEPDVAAAELADLTGTLPRGSARPGGGLRLEWSDQANGATAALLPNGPTAFLAACHVETPAKARASRQAAARDRCLAALDAARVVPAPATAPPITPPPGFRRGLGASSDALYFGVDADYATLVAVESDEPLASDPSPDALSQLTDGLVGGGFQVNSLDVVQLGVASGISFAGKLVRAGTTVEAIGYLLPRGQRTLLLLAIIPAGARGKYAHALMATARSTQGLAMPPGARDARDLSAPAPARAARPAPAQPRDEGLGDTAKAALGALGLTIAAIGTALLLLRYQARERERTRRQARERARRSAGAERDPPARA